MHLESGNKTVDVSWVHGSGTLEVVDVCSGTGWGFNVPFRMRLGDLGGVRPCKTDRIEERRKGFGGRRGSGLRMHKRNTGHHSEHQQYLLFVLVKVAAEPALLSRNHDQEWRQH